MTLLLPCWSPFNLLRDASELFVFPPTWQEEGQAELHWYSYLTQTVYANGWTLLFVNGVGHIVYWLFLIFWKI